MTATAQLQEELQTAGKLGLAEYSLIEAGRAWRSGTSTSIGRSRQCTAYGLPWLTWKSSWAMRSAT